MAAIHENIRKYRLEKNMTLEDLANLVGTTKQTILRYETGEIKNIPCVKIEALTKALGVTYNQLFETD